MRQKLFIFLGLIFLVVVLVGLNVASYVQKEEIPDNEQNPNRSTYNTGATGTRAFFDLLNETGRRAVRWQEPPLALLSAGKDAPQTFVVIGQIRRGFADEERDQLLRWVSGGGKLIVIDREPDEDLLSTTANWSIKVVPSDDFAFSADPSNQQQMTSNVTAGKPVQPSIYTRSVNAVQPSRFASSVKLEFLGTAGGKSKTPAPAPTPKIETAAQNAPVVHLANKNKSLLVDFPYGSGEIVYLSDPYMVSNAGISLVDNLQMAINTVASREGTIAFDEFHQGFGVNENRVVTYFAGTPVMAIFAQIVLLAAVVLFTQSRRFARPLPAAEPNRLSKLEYVSAMAELQQRTRAYDLALENIYSEFRRTMARFVGADNLQTPRHNLARLIAEKSKLDAGELENLMFKCEEIIHGEPTGKKEVLYLTSRLREIEEKLGLKRQRTRRKGM